MLEAEIPKECSDWLGVKEASDRFGIARSTIKRWVSKGDVRYIKVTTKATSCGYYYFVDPISIEQAINRRLSYKGKGKPLKSRSQK